MIAQLVAEARQPNDRGQAGDAPLDGCTAVLDGSSSRPTSDPAFVRTRKGPANQPMSGGPPAMLDVTIGAE